MASGILPEVLRRYFASLDFTPEKCEHFSLLGSKIHT